MMNQPLEHIQTRVYRMKQAIRLDKEQRRRKAGSQVFIFSPFSAKQKKILTWWCRNSPTANRNGIVADGAIRSGKTVSMSLSYGLWAMESFNLQSFLICGKTIGSLRRNVVSVWQVMMKSLGFQVRYARTDNLLTVTKGDKTNYFYLFGGKDEQSQDLVQGITAAGVLFDEVALMPESFVNQATARCSVAGAKFWFNCNPEGPMHWFKTKWIDQKLEKKLVYLHFTMDDNNSLEEQVKERYRSLYSGMFFNRFILGQWTIAEGVIYDMFDKDAHTYGDDLVLPSTGRKFIAIDYGTVNPTVFLDVWDTDSAIYIRREYYYDSQAAWPSSGGTPRPGKSENNNKERRQKTDQEYADDLIEFVGSQMPDRIIIDPSASSLKVELSKRRFRVMDANNEVIDGIRMVASLFARKRLFIHKSCSYLINELHSYAWDEKAAKRGEEKPVKQNDHCVDALRYYVKTRVTRWRFTK